MNKYVLIATLICSFILFPLMTKSVSCKLRGGTPAFATNAATGNDDFVCGERLK